MGVTTNNVPTDDVLRAALEYADRRVMAVQGRSSKDDVGQAWIAFKDALAGHEQSAMLAVCPAPTPTADGHLKPDANGS